MKHATTLLWLFSLSKTTTRCMRAKALLLFYSSVRLVVAMTRVSRLRVETCLSFVVVVRLLYSGLLFVLFVVCVCVLKKKNNFTTTPFFVFCFFLVSFLTSSKNFTFFIDDFLSGQVFRYSSVWCQIKLYLSTPGGGVKYPTYLPPNHSLSNDGDDNNDDTFCARARATTPPPPPPPKKNNKKKKNMQQHQQH